MCYLSSLYIFVTIFHFFSISLSLSIYLVSFSISFSLSFFISFYISFYFLDIFICTYTYMHIYMFTHNVYISLYLQPVNLIVIGLSKDFEKSFTRPDFTSHPLLIYSMNYQLHINILCSVILCVLGEMLYASETLVLLWVDAASYVIMYTDVSVCVPVFSFQRRKFNLTIFA